ncbi:acyl-CoA dehydrogenase [Sphingobium sp. BYY-5]|uniref:acyl-CoA dehydrogenase family protein n=1 Tax=Sphingobium sp. BYY-5 TaxID=2926400 RepID=UPI001FA7AAD3|nr:acyl-CoA dehydrogenase family protein [Sphingobium sp. BYY-5]MCI4592007.1 acyl-CoA dehydrogenase [Sphingobium sp. BYY-5]
MDLALSDDQVAILDAIDTLTRPYMGASLHDTGFALPDAALDRALAEGGFLDVGFDPDLGTVTAALVVAALARLPQAVEAAASAIIRPLLGDDQPRPLCLVEEERAHRPVRFLVPGATILVVGASSISSFIATAEQVRPEPEALYAYPMGSLTLLPMDRATLAVSPQQVLTRWRVALAAEAAGLLGAALDSTVAHVTDRQQFGRPLATFQALRHRLAEAQVRANAVYWLAMKAAATLDPADASLAALHAQESARHAVYDFHQFLGAMGMTLEHPLHLWTYRLKALIGDLGGRGGQALAAAQALWD